MRYVSNWSYAQDGATVHYNDCPSLRNAGGQYVYEADSLEHAYHLEVERQRTFPPELFYGQITVRICRRCSQRKDAPR